MTGIITNQIGFKEYIIELNMDLQDNGIDELVSESRKKAVQKYHQSDKGKKSLKKAQQKYESTEKGKKARKKVSRNRRARNRQLYNAYHRFWNDNKKFRLEILNERNFICFFCNGKFQNEYLHCHYKIPILTRPDLAYDKSNLLLLCIKCHRNLHKNNPNLNNKLKHKSRNLDEFMQ